MLEFLLRRELFGESRDERSIFDRSFVTLLIVSSLLKELCKSRKRNSTSLDHVTWRGLAVCNWNVAFDHMHTLISAIELPNITINVIILHQKVITFRENDEILFLEHPPRLILVPQAFFTILTEIVFFKPSTKFPTSWRMLRMERTFKVDISILLLKRTCW